MSGLDDIFTLFLIGFGPGGLLIPPPPPCKHRCGDCTLECEARREPYRREYEDRYEDFEEWDDR